MTYKDYLSAEKEIDQCRERNWKRIYGEITDIQNKIDKRTIGEKAGK